MRNTYDIVWTHQAKIELEELLEYLSFKWGVRVVTSFSRNLEKSLMLISNYPKISKIHNTKLGVRKYILSKHTSILYSIRIDKIYLLSIFSNYQNPNKVLY